MKIEPELRLIANEHASAYSRYLGQMGVLDTERIGIIDVTTSGRTHTGLEFLLKRNGSKNKLMQGFYTYLASDVLASTVSINHLEGYLFNCTDAATPVQELDMRLNFEEMLLSSPENSMIRAVQGKDDKVEFIYSDGPERDSYRSLLIHIHEGALDFARDFLSTLTEGACEAPSKELAFAGLKRFFNDPSAEEARYFRDRVVARYAVNAQDQLQIVPQFNFARSLVNPRHIKNQMQIAQWKQGYKAALPSYLKIPFAILKVLNNH